MPEMTYLQLQHPDKFVYTRQGGCPTIDGVDDLANFQEICRALSLLGFGEEHQKDIFRILAAILHLGNVQIVHGDHGGSDIATGDTHFSKFCTLIGLDQASSKTLGKWLCNRRSLKEEVFVKPMTKTEASSAHDALVKLVYSLLFRKIVAMINRSLDSSNRVHRFIGVLDLNCGVELSGRNPFRIVFFFLQIECNLIIIYFLSGQPQIVAAVLKHEAIAGCTRRNQAVGHVGRASYFLPRMKLSND